VLLLCAALEQKAGPARLLHSQASDNLPVELERVLSRRMEARAGTVVVQEAASGRILASHRLETAARRLVLPGSVVKTFTLLALLEAGRLPAAEPFVCPATLRIAGRQLDCSHPRPPGSLDPAAALALSCNAFFAEMSLRLTDEELTSALERSGITARTGLASGEASGYVRRSPTRERQQLKAIGEADLGLTPLGVLNAFRKLAQRRAAGKPSRALETLFAGLEAAATQGLAQLASAEGIRVAGKTGTALADEGPWRHGWFAGFAPAEMPEIVIVVYLENGTGPLDAAPIAGEVFAVLAKAKRKAAPRP
jgi:penicillin-binding protein 2